MKNSAGPSGQPCCVPSTKAKKVCPRGTRRPWRAREALGPRSAHTKDKRRS
jgi:hypothetical protein